jgi:glycosyltransferase involved in cell wall biosynthesis
MKKVLFVTPVAPWNLFGGTATVSRNLIEIFRELTQAQICCLRGNEPGVYPRRTPEATVLSGQVSGLVRRLKFFLDFRAGSFAHRQFARNAVRERFAALLAGMQPDLVIFDHIFSAWLIDLVANPATRIAYIAHDDMVAYADSLLQLRPAPLKRLRFAGLHRQYRRLQQKILHRCDFILTMTPEDRARLAKSSHGPVEVAPLFFEFPDFAREDHGAFRYLLVTGSFDTWEKQLGLTQFLETVFAPLLQERPDLRLVIAGRVPPAVREQIRFSEPHVRVVHAPNEAEMHTLLRQASAAAVLDLQASGLKIKTIELAAAGLPLVSWAPGIEGSMLVDGESCLCAASPEEFSRQLDRLYADGDLRAGLGAAARRIVQTEFSRAAASARLQGSRLYSALDGIEAPSRP